MTSIETKLKELEERLAKLEELNGIPADPTLCPDCKIGHLREIKPHGINSSLRGQLECSHCGTRFLPQD